jgi:hypothetical protein
MSTRPATSACGFVLPSVGSALLGVVVMGATVDSDPDPDEVDVADPDSDELHALATTAVTRSTGATQRGRRRP